MLGRKCINHFHILFNKCFFNFKSEINSKLKLQRMCGLIDNYTYVHFVFSSSFVKEISFNNANVKRYILFLLEKYKDAEEKLKTGIVDSKELCKVVSNLQPLVNLNAERERFKKQIQELDSFLSDLKLQKEQELFTVAEQEKQSLVDCISHCETSMLNALIPQKMEDEKDITMEFTAGVGGQEAMLFTKCIFDMYCKYAVYKGWNFEIIYFNESDLGGIRSAHISISGLNAYKLLKFESGVHRVQRIPKTEKAGRIHTSTMTVAVFPQPDETDVVLNPKEIEMVFKNSSGAGGQHVNTTDSCVRLTHIPTGIRVECQRERCQHKNRALALKALKAKLYQLKLENVKHENAQIRKLQIGTAARSDKVRTYNFPQDRVTDHRIHKNIYNLEHLLEGEAQFNDLLQLLQHWYNIEELNEILKEYN